jgi:hypothetical protein
MRMSAFQANSSRLSKKLTVFGTWTVVTTIAMSLLTALHDLPLPNQVSASVTQQACTGPKAIKSYRWSLIHVLAEGCPCSGTVADCLCQRGPMSGVDEIISVGNVRAADGGTIQHDLKAAGFGLVSPEQATLLRALHVSGAPWLIVVDPNGKITYSGGYASVRPARGVKLQDQSILARLQKGQAVDPLPVYGCATDTRLQHALDPLGLKY